MYQSRAILLKLRYNYRKRVADIDGQVPTDIREPKIRKSDDGITDKPVIQIETDEDENDDETGTEASMDIAHNNSDSEIELYENDEDWKPIPGELPLVAKKVDAEGIVYMRPLNSWGRVVSYKQVDGPVIMKTVQKPYLSGTKAGRTYNQQICSVWKNSYAPGEGNFHAEHAHKCGCKCKDCGSKRNHNCVPPEECYVTRKDKIEVAIGRPVSRVFLLPLSLNGSTTLWCGTTVEKTATEGAITAVRLVENAAKTNFATNSNYCTSLADLLHPKNSLKWRASVDDAFFPEFLGGTHNAIDALKFWTRRSLCLPSNHKPKYVDEFLRFTDMYESSDTLYCSFIHELLLIHVGGLV